MPWPAGPHARPADRVLPTTGWPRLAARRPNPRRSRPSVVAAIAVGGVLGTFGRYGVEMLGPSSPGRFPWATFTVNTTGSFALGFVLVLLVSRFSPRSHLRPFLATGVLGAYTTFSSFVVEAARIADGGRPGLAAEYVIVSIGVGLLAAAAGLAAARCIAAAVGAR